MIVSILGSGAGGGFPQWNCNCANCRAVRAGLPGFAPRTQSSVAVSANGTDWLLLNASPDLRQQIAAQPRLAPRAEAGPRSSPIKEVALTSGDVDHVAGLLTLRESQEFNVYASRRVLDALAANPIFDSLAPGLVGRRELALGATTILGEASSALGLDLEAFEVPGKIALYLEDPAAPGYGTREGDTLGLRVVESATGTSFLYLPACARLDAALSARLRGADLLLFDGTLWQEEEMLAQGLMPKTGSRMGHMNMSGADGSIAAIAPLGVRRKVFIHVNNSNPVLDPRSSERAAAQAAGWTIGEDGMEFDL